MHACIFTKLIASSYIQAAAHVAWNACSVPVVQTQFHLESLKVMMLTLGVEDSRLTVPEQEPMVDEDGSRESIEDGGSFIMLG